ncbi:MAG: HAMP domain-containing sensor histidine kinase [Spirochaetales bacterium]|uniref:histidine kinase n=1 Tax=Candidatus Thalassospirochaeta sargassi TaxID=3119039 RepID=A0AAJ1MNZ6_9SPIO|nr:HAMP domain-containing sensor histidine kinase [Spirochaetales bacterium]
MIRLFPWLLRRFIFAFAILVAVQLILYFSGLNLILSGYEDDMLERYESAAVKVLTGNESGVELELPGTGSFFVFTEDRTLVFTNKGKGRSISESDLRPVYLNDSIVGYFHAGELGFTDNQANRVFLSSIIILGVFSAVLSIVIGLIAALYSSRKIAGPISLLRSDIHDIRSMKVVDSREFAISELRVMSQDVSNASKTLSSQEEYKRQWLRDLAHDLRTPLSGLKSQLEAMADGVLEPTAERFRRHLLEIERLENLASSIGELTSVESKENIEKTEIDARSFAERLVSPFEQEAVDKGIRIETRIDEGRIFVDEQLLLRALGNILSNAVKYIDDGDCIRLDLAINPGFLHIEITNNGPNIPEKQQELIFTRLYRGESGRTSPGSGLGLSITREIIKLHGGAIHINNLTPRGVCFVINI